MSACELYCFGESGNAYKVALMLNLSGIDWDARFVDFFNGETRSDAYREELNEMGEVPVLVHGPVKLTQSGVILEYLSELSGSFGAQDIDEHREIMRWILFDNHKLTNSIATLRFLLRFAHSGETPVTEFLRGRAKAAMNILDKHLAGRAFIVAERPTIADVSACGYLYYTDELGFELEPYENVVAWLDRIKQLEGWQHPYELMPRAAPVAT
mgnify:FL=1